MLDIETTPKAMIPHYCEFPDMKVKTHSPYGLPIVDNCVNCKLRNSNFFCSLAPDAMKALNQIKHVSSFPEGAMVFLEGQSARGVYILCQGRVKLMTANSEGKTLILKIAEPGQILGLQSVVSGKSHELTVETLKGLERGEIAPHPQDHGLATLAPMLKKDDGRIDWKSSAEEIWPAAELCRISLLERRMCTAVCGA